MSWTYRVVRSVDDDGEVSYGIHEAYDDGDIEQPHSITTEAVDVAGDTFEDLAETLGRMQSALAKPVLEASAFGKDARVGGR
jgi:hypothetical protein